MRICWFVSIASVVRLMEPQPAAGTVTWTGQGGDSAWETTQNWAGNQVPGVADDVIVPSGVANIYVNVSTQVRGLTLPQRMTLAVQGTGASFVASGPANMDGVSLYVNNGSILSLPGLKNYSAAGLTNDFVYWQAEREAVLDLPSLTNVVGSPAPWAVYVRADNGGRINLGGEFSIRSGSVSVRAYDAKSAIDAPGLRVLAPHWAEVRVWGGGRISMTNLVEYSCAQVDAGNPAWSCDDTGSLLEIDGLTNFVGCPYPWTSYVTVGNGGSLKLGGAFGILAGTVNFYVGGTNSVFLAPGLRRLAPARFSFDVSGGARVSLSALQEWRGDAMAWDDALWRSRDAGSLLDLPALTNFVGSLAPWTTTCYAENGGQMRLGGSFEVVGNWIGFAADSTNSVLVAPGLGRAAAEGFWITVSQGACVSLPQLREYSVAATSQTDLYWDCHDGGSLLEATNLAQFSGSPRPWTTHVLARDGGQVKLGGSFSILGGGVSLVARTNSVLVASVVRLAAEAIEVGAQDGGQLLLPDLQEYSGAQTDRGWTSLYSQGAGGLVDLPALTNLIGSPYPWFTVVYASSGGHVRLGGQFNILSGGVRFSAQDAGTLVEAPSLRRLAPNAVVLSATDGGRVSLLGLREFDGSSIYYGADRWTSSGSNSVLELGGLNSFVAAPRAFWTSLEAAAGGRVSLGGTFEVTRGALALRAEDAGSLLVAQGLTRLAPEALNITVDTGGRISLPGLREFSAGNSLLDYMSWMVTAPGSVLEMPGVTNFLAPPRPNGMTITARNGGQIRLPAVPAILAGNLGVVADGTGSMIDLSSVSRFDPAGGSGGLQALNGGAIALAPIFTLRGAVLEGVSAWGTPAVTNDASVNELVCANVGLAVRIETRPSGQPTAPWQRFGRVAMTTNHVAVRTFFNIPDGTDVRISELLADPPELELHHGQDGLVTLTLFGLPSASYRLDASPTIVPVAVWGPLQQMALSASFGQINFAPTNGDLRIYRAVRQ